MHDWLKHIPAVSLSFFIITEYRFLFKFGLLGSIIFTTAFKIFLHYYSDLLISVVYKLCLLYILLKSNIIMKQNIRITANLNEPGTLKDLVENLASCHTDMGYCKVPVPHQWKALEISSTQAFVRGAFDVHTKTDDTVRQLIMPFTSTFLFTCIKEKCGLFNLEWSLSLS